MLSGGSRTGLTLVLVALAFGACSSPAGKSTGTNWVACKTDVDCKGHPGTYCAESERCEPGRGGAPGVPDAGNGGAMDASSGGEGGGGAGGSGMAGGANSGGTEAGTGARASGLGGANGGMGGSGADPADSGTGGKASAHASGCYSPGQNLETSFSDPNAVGCKCIESQAPNGLCVHMVTIASFGAYLCQDGHWKADTSNAACTGCWTPDEPEFANSVPDRGCTCVNENETACIVTQNDGYKNAVCRGGTWKLDDTLNSCTCTADARCGFGGKCVDGACARRECEVDGVRYAAGVSFPSPSDGCNTCQCDAAGQLTCTTRQCAGPPCPTGTVQARTCAGCGLAGGCGLFRFGCLPRCETSADCAHTGTPDCDPTNHVCAWTGCD